MSGKSNIEWTHATWNPVRGCTEISPGCAHCYAKTFAERWRGIPGHPYEQGFGLRIVPERLEDPIRWKRSRMIFVNSMSDLFHKDVPDEFIDKVFAVMEYACWHVFQVLTKRPCRMREFLKRRYAHQDPPSHIWLGTSVENRKHGLPRIPILADTPAAIRFLSIEPLLEELGQLPLEGIHWVIVGGESGPGCRPMDAAWVRSILAQTHFAGIPFFFKQWGGIRKSERGRTLDGDIYNDMPEVAFGALNPERTQALKRLSKVVPV